MHKLLILFNNVGRLGTSPKQKPIDGGTNIWLHYLMFLQTKNTKIYISAQTGTRKPFMNMLKSSKNITFDEFQYPINRKIYFIEILRRTLGLIYKICKKYKNIDQIISSSDFWPDALPALVYKITNPTTIWVASFFLSAPKPWKKDNPYKGTMALTGFLYWLTQLPVIFAIKKYADYVVVTSEPDVQTFVTKDRSHDKIIIAQGGVDLGPSQKYHNSKSKTDKNIKKYDACFVGRLHFQKGVLELIDIWKLVCQKRPQAQLAIIGIGPLEEEIFNKIQQEGLNNNITMLGYKDGEDKYTIFKQSKIIVHPATYDSGGMAAAEGMAWGLPGVCFDLPALKSYYPQGMLKTECFSKTIFSYNILLLLTNKALYNNISTHAYNLITKHWDWHQKSNYLYNKINHR